MQVPKLSTLILSALYCDVSINAQEDFNKYMLNKHIKDKLFLYNYDQEGNYLVYSRTRTQSKINLIKYNFDLFCDIFYTDCPICKTLHKEASLGECNNLIDHVIKYHSEDDITNILKSQIKRNDKLDFELIIDGSDKTFKELMICHSHNLIMMTMKMNHMKMIRMKNLEI